MNSVKKQEKISESLGKVEEALNQVEQLKKEYNVSQLIKDLTDSRDKLKALHFIEFDERLTEKQKKLNKKW